MISCSFICKKPARCWQLMLGAGVALLGRAAAFLLCLLEAGLLVDELLLFLAKLAVLCPAGGWALPGPADVLAGLVSRWALTWRKGKQGSIPRSGFAGEAWSLPDVANRMGFSLLCPRCNDCKTVFHRECQASAQSCPRCERRRRYQREREADGAGPSL